MIFESVLLTKNDVAKLASIEHTRWAGWQSYLHSKCIKNEDGSLTIPAAYVKHLERQINTTYNDLSESEQNSDLKEVYNTIKCLDDMNNSELKFIYLQDSESFINWYRENEE